MSLSWAFIKDVLSWAKNLAFRPKLRIYFDPSQTYHVAPDLAADGINGMFLHVMIVNRGRTTARKCRALLFEVDSEAKPGAFGPAPLFRNPVELHWAHEDIDCLAKDIPPEQPMRLDVCYANEGHFQLHFFCEKRPRGVQTDFPPGRYKVRIKVRSDDGATCSGRFLLAFDGDFRKLYMEELQE